MAINTSSRLMIVDRGNQRDNKHLSGETAGGYYRNHMVATHKVLLSNQRQSTGFAI